METTLHENQIHDFIHKGYVCIEQAFPEQLAAECRQILWNDLPGNPNDPATWTQPVVRLGYYSQKPFQEAANTPRLRAAFDQLVGAGGGCLAWIWEPFRCVFRVIPIRVIQVGTLM